MIRGRAKIAHTERVQSDLRRIVKKATKSATAHSVKLIDSARKARFTAIQVRPKDRLTLPLAGWKMRQTD
jgi:hypothetical protein